MRPIIWKMTREDWYSHLAPTNRRIVAFDALYGLAQTFNMYHLQTVLTSRYRI